MIELWLFFVAMANSLNEEERRNSILLEAECDSWQETLDHIPTSILGAEHIFIRAFPNRIEVEIQL